MVTLLKRKEMMESVRQNFTIILLAFVVIGMLLLGEILSPGFSSFGHIKDILRTAAFVGLCGIGQTFVILTGGIDLTVSSLITMGQIYGCLFINGSNGSTIFGLGLIILIGAGFGLISGVGVSYLGISPLVMTLAVSSLVSGVTLISINGAPRGVASPWLEKLGAGTFLGFPVIAWIWIVMTILVLLFLRKSVTGRKIYYIGTNPTTAKFSGIRVREIRTLVYVLSAAFSAFTGALLAGNTSRAFIEAGKEYTMWSITAVVVGGTAMTGGKGGYLGTAAGALIIIMLEGILTV